MIAEKDLEIRGPGELLGTKQTGDMGFRVARLKRDDHFTQPGTLCGGTNPQDYPQHADGPAKTLAT